MSGRPRPPGPGIPPGITAESGRFWEGASRGELVVERCEQCGRNVFPPRGRCSGCGSRVLADARIDGDGIIYSFTVNWNAWQAGMEVPFALVLVEFPEAPGFRLLGRLHGADLDSIRIGHGVELRFDEGPEGPAGVRVPGFVWKGGAG